MGGGKCWCGVAICTLDNWTRLGIIISIRSQDYAITCITQTIYAFYCVKLRCMHTHCKKRIWDFWLNQFVYFTFLHNACILKHSGVDSCLIMQAGFPPLLSITNSKQLLWIDFQVLWSQNCTKPTLSNLRTIYLLPRLSLLRRGHFITCVTSQVDTT